MSELRSALVVAVPEASEAVDGWRERTCHAKPSRGVPPHVTLLFPFVPAADLGEPLVGDLGALFGRFAAFRFELRESRRFPEVLYLAPEPPRPFVRLTKALVAEYPEYPPYAGEVSLDEIVPHLTVAEGDAPLLDEAEHEIEQLLPIGAEAREVVLLEELEPDSALWRTRAQLQLGGA